MTHLDEANGRPVQQKFLDYLQLKPNLKEEVQSALHKVAELKLRPEKIPDEEDVVKPVSWKSIKDLPYLDPVPPSMLHVSIRELSTVSIDWKMLTLDRPESQVEIQIFSRMVYLDKLMLQCVTEERKKKAREKYVRLRTKGLPKPPSDSDVDRSDEFTYEYFSRFSGSGERQQAAEEVPKPKVAEEPKARPTPAGDVPAPNRTPVPPARKKSKKTQVRRKLKKRRKKKSNRKRKLRKRKLATKGSLKPKPAKCLRKPKKGETTSKSAIGSVSSKLKKRKRVVSTKTTLVQMLQAKDKKGRRKNSGSETEVGKVSPRKHVDSLKKE